MMDNLQSNVFVAGQRLNDLTGYSSIEALKNDIHFQGTHPNPTRPNPVYPAQKLTTKQKAVSAQPEPTSNKQKKTTPQQ